MKHINKGGCLSHTLYSLSGVFIVLFSDAGNGSRSCICLNAKQYNVMKKKTIVTYSVTFSQDFIHLGIPYYAGVEYQFTVATEEKTTAHADIFDVACSNYFKLFGLSDENGNYIHRSSDIHYPDPTIISVKDMAEPEATKGQPSSKAIVTISGNRTYSIEYLTLSDLSESIWALLFDASSQFECTVALASGEKYNWK